MSRTVLRTSREWLVVGLVAATAFAYFTAGSSVLALMADAAISQTATAAVVRLALAIVIATALLVSERRRDKPSVDAAMIDGIQVAAVVIITHNLLGATDTGARLAVRTAMIVIGLPLLAVLTHLLVRRVHARTFDGSS